MSATPHAKKAKAKKAKKISFSLSEREGEKLRIYALEHGISRPVAAKRLVREALKQYHPAANDKEPQNQLGLFDILQVDILNNTSKIID